MGVDGQADAVEILPTAPDHTRIVVVDVADEDPGTDGVAGHRQAFPFLALPILCKNIRHLAIGITLRAGHGGVPVMRVAVMDGCTVRALHGRGGVEPCGNQGAVERGLPDDGGGNGGELFQSAHQAQILAGRVAEEKAAEVEGLAGRSGGACLHNSIELAFKSERRIGYSNQDMIFGNGSFIRSETGALGPCTHLGPNLRIFL